jgi:5-methylcytosine-specific restriction endonuclease McrA
MKQHPLDDKAAEIIQHYRSEEQKLISILQQIEAKFVYRELGYSSMYQYCVERHKFSESRAYELIYVSRKCTEVPKLKAAIEAGAVSVSAAKRIGSVVTNENGDLWINQAATLKQKDLERAVATVNPKAAVKEMVKPVAGDRSMLIVGISPALEKKLARVRELVAQSSSKPCDLEQALDQMADLFLERKDPVKRAERITQKKLAAEAKANQHVSSKVARPVQKPSPAVARQTRSPIPAAIRHQVMLRDRGECQGKTPQGTRWGCRQWTDIHHIHPISLGGSNNIDNLLTLCRSHHRLAHERTTFQTAIPNAVHRARD